MNPPPPWLVPVLTRVADVLAKLRRRLIPREYALLELATMSWVSHAIAAFCELGLPEALSAAPRTAEELASQGFGDRDRVFRLLRALAAYDVVAYAGNGRFTLGYLGRALHGESSAAPAVLYANVWWHAAGHTHLAQGIREGRSGFETAQRTSLFEYCAEHPKAGETFDRAMQALTALFAQAFANAYDFSAAQHIVDVGGGTGALLRPVLHRFPNVRGTVFELPGVVARVPFADRLAAVAGDIFTDAPPSADVYVLSHVLHDWDDGSCVQILQNVRKAMPPNARVLVYELVAQPASNWWTQDRLSDLEMLAMLPGRERTLDEFTALFERAGLHLQRVIPTGAPESIMDLSS